MRVISRLLADAHIKWRVPELFFLGWNSHSSCLLSIRSSRADVTRPAWTISLSVLWPRVARIRESELWLSQCSLTHGANYQEFATFDWLSGSKFPQSLWAVWKSFRTGGGVCSTVLLPWTPVFVLNRPFCVYWTSKAEVRNACWDLLAWNGMGEKIHMFSIA